MSTAVHRSPNKLWRSNSIFKPMMQTIYKSVLSPSKLRHKSTPLSSQLPKTDSFFTSIQSFCLYMSVQERNRVASAYWISVRNMRCSREGLKLFLSGLWCTKVCKISCKIAERINIFTMIIQVQSSIQCAVLIEMKSKRRMGINVVGYIPKHHRNTVPFSSGFCDSWPNKLYRHQSKRSSSKNIDL